MAERTYGELNRFHYKTESAYASPPSGTLVWGGEILSVKPNINRKRELLHTSGSRGFSEANLLAAPEIGFTIKLRQRAISGGVDWTTLAAYALGSTSGLADHLGSFTGLVSETVGATTYRNVYYGCKANKLTIESAEQGALWEFTYEFWAQFVDWSTTTTFARLNNYTIGATPTAISTSVLARIGQLQYNLGGGLTDWDPADVKITISNDLTRHPGNKLGYDATNYALSKTIDEGKREITVEITKPHEDETWENAKHLGTALSALTFPIGAKTLTLTDGVLDGGDLVDRRHAKREETVKASFKSLSIA
jgi:hypothetical protein